MTQQNRITDLETQVKRLKLRLAASANKFKTIDQLADIISGCDQADTAEIRDLLYELIKL